VEILVAQIIISVLMGAVGFAYFANVQKARVVAAKSQIKSFEAALTNFFLDTGHFPATSEGLEALVTPPSDASTKWKGPYLTGKIPKDPWGNDYVYMAPASNNTQPYEIRSYNRDGANGGSGDDADIVSWDLEASS
jgi:general secretion pathway protein G